MGSCGGSQPSTPNAPGPTPSVPAPSPDPASAGFLHVQGGATYSIDAVTGLLRETAATGVVDILAGEPHGRYVYAGRRNPGALPSIVSYAPDPSSGRLTALSEASSRPGTGSSTPTLGQWVWLSASSTRVYAVYETTTYHDRYYTLVTHTVSDDGRLGPAHWEYFPEGDGGIVALDGSGDLDIVYKEGLVGTVQWKDIGLTAHVVEPDGRLTQLATSSLCADATMEYAVPLVTAGGFVFGYGDVGDHSTVCSWETPYLTPRADLGLRLRGGRPRAVACTPRPSASAPASTATPLVAMATSEVSEAWVVGLFAARGDGSLKQLDAATVPMWEPMDLVFHPSCGFLYVTSRGPRDLLTVYSIEPGGRLAVVETREGTWRFLPLEGRGGGRIAVTVPPLSGTTFR